MMTRFATVAAATVLALSLPAQVQVFGGPGERAAATLIFFDGATQSAAGMAIQYGQPAWKDAYEGQIDQLKGKRARLGKDWWTTFDTSVPVDFGGVAVPAGSYFLGLECSADGNFSLAVMSARAAMTAGAMPFTTEDWKVAHSIPMQLTKVGTTTEKLSIGLAAAKSDPSAISLTINWGNQQLAASGKASLGPKPEKKPKPPADKAGDGKGGDGKKG